MKNQDKFNESAAQIRKLMTSVFIIFMIAATVLVYLLIDPSLSAFSSNKVEKNMLPCPKFQTTIMIKSKMGSMFVQDLLKVMG